MNETNTLYLSNVDVPPPGDVDPHPGDVPIPMPPPDPDPDTWPNPAPDLPDPDDPEDQPDTDLPDPMKASLLADIEDRIADMPSLANADVRTRLWHGKVLLTGVTDSAYQRRWAGRCAVGVAGDVPVLNQIEVAGHL